MDQSIWGRGIGTLCCKKGCEHWFQDKFGIDEIETYAYPDNLASQRILEKCGFKNSGKKIIAKVGKWDAELDDFTGDLEEIECDIVVISKSDFEKIK